MLASMRSALEYLADREYSWNELEKLTGYRPERAAWTVKMWTELARQGFKIRMIEGFDYDRYFKEGEAYLSTFLKPEEVKWQLKETNLLEIRPLIPEFLKTIHYEKRSPQLEDIDKMLEEGYLVTVQLNSKALNDQAGYVAHMILVHDKIDSDYIAHDPGPPATPRRKIEPAKLLEAMGGTYNTVEVTGVKK